MDRIEIAIHYSVLYCLIVFLSIIFSAFAKMGKVQKKTYLFCVISIFFVIMAFRSAGMGNDTQSYIDMFNRISVSLDPIKFSEGSAVERGYVIYNYILAKVFDNNPRWLFLITATFVCLSIGRYIYKYSKLPGVVCCLFLPFCFSFHMSIMRQAIASAIFLFAYDYIIEKKLVSFLILCFLALQFHNSAIIFPIIYILVNFRSSKAKSEKWFEMILWVATIGCFLFFDKFLLLLLEIFPKYTYYVGSVLLDGEPRTAVYLQIAVAVLMLSVPNLVNGNNLIKTSHQVLDKKMAILNLAMLIISSNATALNRMCYYFKIFTLNQYGNDLAEMRNSNRIIVLIFTIIAFYLYGLIIAIYKTPEWETTYPILLQWKL